MTVNTLNNLRSDKKLFWADVISKAEEGNIEEPALSRRRTVPAKRDCGIAAPKYFQTPKQLTRAIYYEALHLIVSLIKDRFDQRDYNVYMNCEQLRLKKQQLVETHTKMNFKLLVVSMAPILIHESWIDI